MSTEKAKAKQIQVDANIATPAGSLQELIEARKILPTATTALDGAMSKEDKAKLQDLPTNSELVSTLDARDSTLDTRITSEVADIASDLTGLTADKYDKTGGHIDGDVNISGKLTVQGGMAEVEAEHVSTSDTIIRLNDGEVGAGVTNGFAGVEIDRGVEGDYEFGFNESTELFEVGKAGDRQPLLTRMLAPVANKFFRWNDTTKQAETADITWGDVTGKLSDVSKTEAEAGTGTTTRFWSSLRVREAILGWWNTSASKAKLDGIQADAQVNTVTAVAGKTGAVSVTKGDVGLSNVDNVKQAPSTRTITAGTGLSGGGNLTADRTLSVNYGTAASTAAQGNDSRLSNSREWTATTISQAEAEAGTAATRKAWTAVRVRQAIAAWWSGSTFKTKLDGIAAGADVTDYAAVSDEIDAKVDAVEVGGRNLLKGSAEFDSQFWSNRNYVASAGYYHGMSVVKTPNAWGGKSYDPAKLEGVEDDSNYVLSVLVKADFDASSSTGLVVFFGSPVNLTLCRISDIGLGWQKFSLMISGSTLNSINDSAGIRFECTVSSPTGKAIYFTGYKLEKGNKATDWTPAPEDVTAHAENYTDTAITNLGLSTAATKNVGTGTDDIQTNSQNRSEFAAKSGGDFTTDIIVNALTVGRGGGDSAASAVLGKSALRDNTTGFFNTACGGEALVNNITGYKNTGIGRYALGGNTIFNNCSGFGYNAQVTGLNQVQLGDSATTTYAYGPVQNRSDIRDKADVRDTALGLDFINALRPVDFRWDMREDYRPDMPEKSEDESDEAFKSRMDEWHEFVKMANITTDGTHKRSRYHHGLIAQEVKSVIDTAGIDFGGFQDHKLSGGDDVLSLGYEELIAPLIKAVQELTARIDILESKEQP